MVTSMPEKENIHMIPEDAEGMRLDRWLCKAFPEIPYTAWAKLCRKGNVRLNGKRIKGAEHIAAGDKVRLPPQSVLKDLAQEKKTKKKPKFTKDEISAFAQWIVFENNDLLCLNKPAGFASQGGTGIKKSVDALALEWGAEKGIQPKLLHRLDKDTSGLLMLAKNTKTARTLGKGFKEGNIKKFYIAILKGVPHPLQSRIIAPIEKGVSNEKEKMIVSEKGKKTITDFEVIEHLGKKVSIVLLSPQTGRTHQLRVHMAYLGTPIVGDYKYGEGEFLDCDTLCLHAYTASLPGMRKKPQCDLPPHMEKVVNELGFSQKELANTIQKRIQFFSRP